MPEPIIMWAIAVIEPHYYAFCPQHDIITLIQYELAKIGIDLHVAFYDAIMLEDAVWGITWNRNGTHDGDPFTHTYGEDGWDLVIYPWRQNPISYIWLDRLVYSWGTPPEGWNFMSWNNTKADIFYQRAMTTSDPETHKRWIWKWQEEFMHNPPVAVMYYADVMTAWASYLNGYDNTAWLYDLSQIDINETKFNEVTPAARRAIGNDKLIYAVAAPIWSLFPLGTLTHSEEAVNVLKQGMLYRTSRENLVFPPGGDYTVIPTLADDFPTWYQKPDGRWVARVPLRSGITWTDGEPFNASDVAFTYNAILNPSIKSESYGDYSFLLDSVDVVDTYTVDFVYKPGMGPDYDFAGYQAHGWALGMLPWHQLKDVNLNQWKTAPFNTDLIPDSADGQLGFTGPNKGLEALGPYIPVSHTGDPVGFSSITFQKRAEYASALGYSSTLPDSFILKIIPDSANRLVALQNLEVDFAEDIDAPVALWEGMKTWPTHRIVTSIYPASHNLWMQHTNRILSNRYVRLAIAHAIPYKRIFNEILPSVGVAAVYPGKTFITPWQEGFHSQLGSYEYNITKAQQYMDMWRYSQDGTDYTKGPLGDHDFSGFAEMIDYPVWADNFFKYTYELPWYPSKPVDPDNDNDGQVLVADINLWGLNFGKRYPYQQGSW